MISSEVQRTLVKSPPELWAELSDPAALARHLGELGEIRITRTEPEKLVEWEAEGTKGTVAIKASGWGTKVTLSVSRELPATEPSEPGVTAKDAGESEPVAEIAVAAVAEQQAAVEPETASIEAPTEPSSEQSDQPTLTAAERFAHDDPEPLLGTRLGSDHEDEDVERDEEIPTDVNPGPSAENAEPTEPRRGFLARLFGRRRKHAEPMVMEPEPDGAAQDDAPSGPSIAAPAASDVPEAPQAPLAPLATAEEPQLPSETGTIEDSGSASMEPEISVPDEELTTEQAPPEPVADLSAELQEAEEAASEEVTAVLTGMLDRLGAAHHRPFSRA